MLETPEVQEGTRHLHTKRVPLDHSPCISKPNSAIVPVAKSVNHHKVMSISKMKMLDTTPPVGLCFPKRNP